MTKPIDKSRITLTVLQVVSIALGVLAVVFLVAAIYGFHSAHQYLVGAQTHPNAAEDTPHGLDGLGVIFADVYSVVMLVISIALFIPAVVLFIEARRGSRKKAQQAQQLESLKQPVIVTPQTPKSSLTLSSDTEAQTDESAEKGRS